MAENATRPAAGLLLAAGAGRRIGTPKALLADECGTPWVARGAQLLLDAGCDPVIVVLGAEAVAAQRLLPSDDRVEVVIADNWETGMAASLSAGLLDLTVSEADRVIVTLVDLPELPLSAVQRFADSGGARALRQAVYGGRAGHPVLIGRDHWPGVLATIEGDHGARQYLIEHRAEPVECGDLWSGQDVDTLDR